MSDTKITWMKAPEDHDYTAAESYLKLIYDDKTVASLLQQLQNAPMSEFKSKDLFRASGLSLLGVSNQHVDKDRQKLSSGKPLSPLLLVRDPAHGTAIIADGYHRLCAVYSFDEDAIIPCKIVGV